MKPSALAATYAVEHQRYHGTSEPCRPCLEQLAAQAHAQGREAMRSEVLAAAEKHLGGKPLKPGERCAPGCPRCAVIHLLREVPLEVA